MTKQEMLYEQYNDALFRLLMHSVAQHQGQQYQEENQALKAQEGGPSETAKRRCLRTISRQVRRGHARAAARRRRGSSARRRSLCCWSFPA